MQSRQNTLKLIILFLSGMLLVAACTSPHNTMRKCNGRKVIKTPMGPM